MLPHNNKNLLQEQTSHVTIRSFLQERTLSAISLCQKAWFISHTELIYG